MDIRLYISELEKAYNEKADADRAQKMKAYLRDKFEHIGLSTPTRRDILKEHNKKFGKPDPANWLELIDRLWEMPFREYQYTAVELLSKNTKILQVDDLDFLESLVLRKSWWDTVDGLAATIFGAYFQMYPNKIKRTDNYVSGDNFWLQRVAILFQLKYKNSLNTALLSDYILRLAHSDEFFIRKAIGWILREYAKTNPVWVVEFVNSSTLKPLSRREALKNIR